MVTLEVATTTGVCPFAKTPPEVMEMIFGKVNFPDLPAVIHVSKWIKVCQSMCVFCNL